MSEPNMNEVRQKLEAFKEMQSMIPELDKFMSLVEKHQGGAALGETPEIDGISESTSTNLKNFDVTNETTYRNTVGEDLIFEIVSRVFSTLYGAGGITIMGHSPTKILVSETDSLPEILYNFRFIASESENFLIVTRDVGNTGKEPINDYDALQIQTTVSTIYKLIRDKSLKLV